MQNQLCAAHSSLPHDDVASAVVEQFEDQTTTRLLITALEEYEDSGATQIDVKKTPAKMLPSTLSKYCMCTICIFVVND